MFEDLKTIEPFTGDVMTSSYPCIDAFNQLRGFVFGEQRCLKGAPSMSTEDPHH